MKKFRISPVLYGNCVILPNNDRLVMDTCEGAKDVYDALVHMKKRSYRAGVTVTILGYVGACCYCVYVDKKDEIKSKIRTLFNKEEA